MPSKLSTETLRITLISAGALLALILLVWLDLCLYSYFNPPPEFDEIEDKPIIELRRRRASMASGRDHDIDDCPSPIILETEADAR